MARLSPAHQPSAPIQVYDGMEVIFGTVRFKMVLKEDQQT